MSVSGYPLGHTQSEMARLVFQASMLEATTRRLLLSAGLKPGMRVLDLGCGPGDVSMLLASLVGPEGSVTGIDRHPAVIELAQHRAAEAEFKNIHFATTLLTEFDDDSGFDFIVGRYVLMYQTDPALFLQRAVSLLRHGGTLAFHEVDIVHQPLSTPFLPLFDTICAQTLTAFRSALSCHNVALTLGPLLHATGLQHGGMFCEIPVETAPAANLCRWWAESFISVSPHVAEIAAPSGEAIAPADLIDALMSECREQKGQIEFMRQVCAWVTRP